MKCVKWFIPCVVAILALACGPSAPERRWVIDHQALTTEERELIDSHIRSVLCTTKRDLSLGNDDQDLEDYAEAVYTQARRSLLRPRLFEFEYNGSSFSPTGRFKELAEAKEE